jgi:hypothetical protein
MALKLAKSTRNAVCNRVGILKRNSSKPRIESAFMDAARRRLDPDLFHEIMVEARAATTRQMRTIAPTSAAAPTADGEQRFGSAALDVPAPIGHSYRRSRGCSGDLM